MKSHSKIHSAGRILSSLLLLSALIGCARGALPESSTTSSSRGIWYTTTTTGTGTTIPTWSGNGGSGEPLLHCSPFHQKQIVFAGNVASLDNGSGGIDTNRVGMIVAAYPADFLNTDDTYIQIFRWRAPNASSSPIVDNTALLLELHHIPTGQSAAINLGRDIKFDKAAIARAATRIGVENKPYDFAILINGTTYEWQALMIAVRKGTSDLGVSQTLLPGFLANPNAYAAYRPGVLADIHPLKSKSSEGWLSNDFRIAGESLCRSPLTMAALNTDTRFIASEENLPPADQTSVRGMTSEDPNALDPWLAGLTLILFMGIVIALFKRKKLAA